MKINERQKKLLLVGALLLSIAAIYRLLPIFDQLVSTEAETFAEQKIFTLQKKVLQKKSLEKERLSLDLLLNKREAGLLKGTTYALAAVTIQNVVYDLAHKHNVDIQSVRVLKTAASDDKSLAMYATVSIQIAMEVSIGQLKKILYDLANSSNLLVVDALNVQVLKKGQPGNVATTLTLKGLMTEQ